MSKKAKTHNIFSIRLRSEVYQRLQEEKHQRSLSSGKTISMNQIITDLILEGCGKGEGDEQKSG